MEYRINDMKAEIHKAYLIPMVNYFVDTKERFLLSYGVIKELQVDFILHILKQAKIRRFSSFTVRF